MVDVLVYIALGVSFLSLGSLVVLARYLPVLRRASAAYVDSSDVISSMMKELNARASFQDRRLADAQVKLDVLEDRWLRSGWASFQAPVSHSAPATDQNSKIRESDAAMIRRRLEPVWSAVRSKDDGELVNQSDLRPPSKVEVLVLKNLVGRRMTAPEVKGVLGSSREHAARMMKSLADRGLVVRDASKKPYSYVLSDAGRDMVTGNNLPGL
jgi:hypothetical protein